MPYLPPSTLPGVAPSPSGGFVAAPMATTVPQTQAATQFTIAPVTAKLAPVLATDRAAGYPTLGKDDLGSGALGESTVGTPSGGGGSGSDGSLPSDTTVPDVVGETVDENGNDVSDALGTSIGGALRASLVPLAIGAAVGALLGFALSR